MDNIDEEVDKYKSVKELANAFNEDPEKFKRTDEVCEDITETFISGITEDAIELFDEMKMQKNKIDKLYSEFLLYIGDDIKKLPLDDFVTLLKNFADSIEVNY